MKPSIYYPVKPFHVNQPFGANIPCVQNLNQANQIIVNGSDENTCPVGYTKLYAAFGMKGHDGIDLQAGVQNIYAAMDGTVIEKQTVASRGLGLGIISPHPLDLGTIGIHYLKLRYWHLKSFNVEVGDSVRAGDLIGVSDNTGYSGGNHLHFEGNPMSLNTATGHYGLSEPENGYAGAIDISPYFNGQYAQDIQVITLYQRLINVLQALVVALKSHKTT